MNTPTIHVRDYFTSVGDVWLIWVVCLAALVVLVRRAYRAQEWGGVAAFADDERGASYALSYVLTFPFYLFLMCLIIQATLVLMVKMGTVYAAYAAARSATVWRPSQPERPNSSDNRFSHTEDMAQRAAAMAMAPFASGMDMHGKSMLKMGRFPRLDAVGDLPHYLAMYGAISLYNRSDSKSPYLLRNYDAKQLPNISYVTKKFLFASAATNVELKPTKLVPWNQDVQVTVSYLMPMHVPAVGRIFGGNTGEFFAREITTGATIPSEAAETQSGRINIPYDPLNL
jgi:hypothetical protein